MKEAFNFNFDIMDMVYLITKDMIDSMKGRGGGGGMNEISNDTYEDHVDYTEMYSDYMTDTFFGLQCNCRPSCKSITYNAKKSIKELNWKQHIEVTQKNNAEYEGMKFARIMVIYTDNKVLTSERKELFGFEDFVGNCGGLLGLFTGFSFLSGFEILYYLTLRLWCKIKRFKRKMA